MAGKQTSLITGSNCKIRWNGKTLAYATDLQYDVSVQTIPVEVMGKYEVLANEPISYVVAGSFSVVRYTKVAAEVVNGSAEVVNGKSVVNGAAANGNSVHNWSNETNSARGSAHVNPQFLLDAQTVDIEVFQKVGLDSAGTQAEDQKVIKIIDARIVRRSASVNKRGVMMESYQFVAELMEDEMFTVGNSGDVDLT
jgi:hypothetical protein